jgi:uncharacterized protein YdiU (UPF0061 family)
MEMTNADYTNTFRHLTWDSLPNNELYTQEGFKLWHQRWEERISQNDRPSQEAFELMKKVNPVFIPRNHLVEEALEAATVGKDFSFIYKLLEVLSNPYSFSKGNEKYLEPPVGGEAYYRTFCNT